MDFKHFVSFCLLYLTQSGPLRKKCCQHCRGYLSWTLETETCFLGHIPLVNLTLSHIQLLTDWTVRYTPPIHWYEWQLVFSVFRHSPLCQPEQLFFTKPRNVWCHIVQLVFSPTNSRLWGFFFLLCSQSQDAPPTVIWGWVMCCFTDEGWKRLMGLL